MQHKSAERSANQAAALTVGEVGWITIQGLRLPGGCNLMATRARCQKRSGAFDTVWPSAKNRAPVHGSLKNHGRLWVDRVQLLLERSNLPGSGTIQTLNGYRPPPGGLHLIIAKSPRRYVLPKKWHRAISFHCTKMQNDENKKQMEHA